MNKLTIYSAGSFRYALLELTRAFKQCHEVEIECILGPAGLLKTRIIQGALADLFISANSENVSAHSGILSSWQSTTPFGMASSRQQCSSTNVYTFLSFGVVF